MLESITTTSMWSYYLRQSTICNITLLFISVKSKQVNVSFTLKNIYYCCLHVWKQVLFYYMYLKLEIRMTLVTVLVLWSI